MRKIVYYTTEGQTTSYAEAAKVGIVRTALEEIPEPVYKADHRDIALASVKLGLKMV